MIWWSKVVHLVHCDDYGVVFFRLCDEYEKIAEKALTSPANTEHLMELMVSHHTNRECQVGGEGVESWRLRRTTIYSYFLRGCSWWRQLPLLFNFHFISAEIFFHILEICWEGWEWNDIWIGRTAWWSKEQTSLSGQCLFLIFTCLWYLIGFSLVEERGMLF